MSRAVTRADHDVVDLDGGEDVMGSDRHHPEEAPAHRVRVGPFAIDPARAASRRPRRIDTGMSHIGFRCAWPAVPSHDPSPRSTREQP